MKHTPGERTTGYNSDRFDDDGIVQNIFDIKIHEKPQLEDVPELDSEDKDYKLNLTHVDPDLSERMDEEELDLSDKMTEKSKHVYS